MDFKRYFVLFVIVGLVAGSRISQAQNQAYVQTDVIKVAGVTTAAQIAPLPLTQRQTSIVYYDGLGRPLQSIAEQASPSQHDMIQPVAYDALGRQTMSYLPYTDESNAPTGSYRANALTPGSGQPAFYGNNTQYLIATDGAPYAQNVIESSPLQRLLQTGMVGTGFQPGVANNHYKTVSYRSNISSDGNILQWNPDGTYTSGSVYGSNMLAVTDGVDEDNVETLAFTDFEGHTILKRQVYSTGNLDTYYIYNNAGMLIYVVPPNATALLAANGYNLTVAPLSNMVFFYVYDTSLNFGRLIQRTVPGKGTSNIVYDPLNRPVLIQDANMAQSANYNWNYIKYDAKGRAVSKGIYHDATHTTLAAMQAYVNTLAGSYNTIWYEYRTASASTTGYYTNAIFPTTGITPLEYAYYDDYNMTESGSPDFSYQTQGLPNEETATTAAVKGVPTMTTKTTVGAGLSATWLTTVTFYDKRGHAIQSLSNNQLNYTNVTTVHDSKTNVPDFTGVPQVTLVKKVVGSGTTTVQSNLTYDQVNRLQTITQQYNGGAASVVASYVYNEIGQQIQKNLGQVATGTIPANITTTTYSATTLVATNSINLNPNFTVPAGSTLNAFISTGYLQTVDYRYNIRGQLLSINNSKLSNDGGITNNDNTDLFGMQLMYDQPDTNLGDTAYYDGKLSAVKWMSKDASGNSTYERAYMYSYDKVNRYRGETYVERATAGTGAFNNNLHGFDETGIRYDAGGNILTLNRNSSTQGTNSNTPIDALVYTYSTSSPDQLATVTDGTGANYTGAGFRNLTGTTTGTYSYDNNGNLTADPYKGLNIGYDVLNRTDKITVTTGTSQYINYTYDADGSLIRKQAYNNGSLQTTTDYVDGFVYINSTLSYFPMPEGRVLNNSGTLVQEFVITDQQGNARLSFQNGGNNTPIVKQENSYYGFGYILPNSPVGPPTVPNKQLYNGGSEWQNDYSNLPDYYQTFNRNYDAAIGRFVGVDPMAESAESMTTYNYAGNNPIMFNDPAGNKMRLHDNTIQVTSGDNLEEDDGLGNTGGTMDLGMSPAAYQSYVSLVGLYNANPGAYWSAYQQTNGTLGAINIYTAPNADAGTRGSGSLTAALAVTYSAINPATGVDTYISNSGQVTTMQRPVSTEPSTISVQDANNTWSFVNAVVGVANQGGMNGLSVLRYSVYNGNGTGGLYINLGFKYSGSGLTNFNFVQTIRTNQPLGGAKSPYNDPQPPDDNLPFYWTNAELPGETNQNGFNVLFSDRPSRGMQNGTTWQAELSVVGMNSSGHYVPITTITYGFQIINNAVVLSPITTVSPSAFQMHSIP